MIVYKTGNILDDDADWLVNPVNCVGVMGAGLAKQFKEKYPRYFQSYNNMCNLLSTVTPGLVIYHDDNFSERNIISFPTKDHWKHKSELIWIDNGLENLHYTLPFCKSIAFPKLGCGLGGLDWETEVKPLMEAFAAKVPDVEVRVYV